MDFDFHIKTLFDRGFQSLSQPDFLSVSVICCTQCVNIDYSRFPINEIRLTPDI